MISSANTSTGIFTPPIWIPKPLLSILPTAFLIYIANKKGDITHPCLNPIHLPSLLPLISPPPPPNWKLPSFSSYILWINLNILPPYPASFICSQSTSLTTLSYAFLMSRNASLYSLPSLTPAPMISPRMYTTSIALLPSLKANWRSLCTTLASASPQHIPQYFSIHLPHTTLQRNPSIIIQILPVSPLSPAARSPPLHTLGTYSSSLTTLNNCSVRAIIISPPSFRNSFGIPLSPTALRLLACFHNIPNLP